MRPWAIALVFSAACGALNLVPLPDAGTVFPDAGPDGGFTVIVVPDAGPPPDAGPVPDASYSPCPNIADVAFVMNDAADTDGGLHEFINEQVAAHQFVNDNPTFNYLLIQAPGCGAFWPEPPGYFEDAFDFQSVIDALCVVSEGPKTVPVGTVPWTGVGRPFVVILGGPAVTWVDGGVTTVQIPAGDSVAAIDGALDFFIVDAVCP